MARTNKRTQALAALSQEELPSEVRCEYPSKFCNNPKASKQKGGVHKFCDFHRRKANMNQKRWQQRRRDQRDNVRKQNDTTSSAPVVVVSKASTKSDDDDDALACTPPPQAQASSTTTTHHAFASPCDFFDPFPVANDFAGASHATSQVYAPPVYFAPPYNNAPFHHYPHNATSAASASGASGGLPEDDLDALTAMLFHETMLPVQHIHWPTTSFKIEQGFDLTSSGYTITGHDAAIV